MTSSKPSARPAGRTCCESVTVVSWTVRQPNACSGPSVPSRSGAPPCRDGRRCYDPPSPKARGSGRSMDQTLPNKTSRNDNHLSQSVLVPDVVLAGELGDVAVKMLWAELVENAFVRPFERRPETFDAVDMSLLADVLASRTLNYSGSSPRVRGTRDRDQTYGAYFDSRVDGLGIEQVLTAPRSPWQNPLVERMIGSIRRECLDHVIVLDEQHLRRILRKYVDYYHSCRTHLSLEKDAPEPRRVESPAMGKVSAIPKVGGLHHYYTRRAA